MRDAVNVAIIGGGPNGLSIASHLAARKVAFRIFGRPMDTWLTQMPRGMMLKSEGFASCLDDPHGHLSLAEYCRGRGLPYADIGLPVPLATFCDYGLDFQRLAVPTLAQNLVMSLERDEQGFALSLDSGEKVRARRVVVAVGITHFGSLPTALSGLPRELVSHSSAHADLTPFRGRRVVVVGGGASAIDLAALLHEAGAAVTLAVRRATLEIHGRMRLPRPLVDRLREPMSGIGPSWRSWFFTNMPLVFHGLPERRRVKWVKNHLGPAGGWFMAERVHNRFPLLLGHSPIHASARGDKVHVKFASNDGTYPVLEADHVIAATGFRPSLRRLPFMAPGLASSIALTGDMPLLSSRFESTEPGLYFVGPMAANSFGPLMRFACAASFTAPHIARYLAQPGAPKARKRHWGADSPLELEAGKAGSAD